MPYSRPDGVRVDVVATKQVLHGAPCVEDGFPGVAVKTKEEEIVAGITARTIIVVTELFNQITAGIVQIANPADAFGLGDEVWIDPDDNSLADSTGGNRVKFGRVLEVAGDRKTPVGKMRVSLDAKDTF